MAVTATSQIEWRSMDEKPVFEKQARHLHVLSCRLCKDGRLHITEVAFERGFGFRQIGHRTKDGQYLRVQPNAWAYIPTKVSKPIN